MESGLRQQESKDGYHNKAGPQGSDLHTIREFRVTRGICKWPAKFRAKVVVTSAQQALATTLVMVFRLIRASHI